MDKVERQMSDKDPWEKIIAELLSAAGRSLSARRSGKGLLVDIVQSAIASGLAKEDCPPLDDPRINAFLLKILIRKRDTYGNNYRTGEGKTRLASQNPDSEVDFFNVIADLKRVAPESALDPPPIDQLITRSMVEHCMNWVTAQIGSFSDQVHQDVARLWFEGCSIERTEEILDITNHNVKVARRAIKAELRKRASA